jgi:hypothetical protein
MRVVVLSTVLLALAGAGMALFLSPLWPAAIEPATATSREPLTPSSAGETCLRLSDHSSE